MEENHMDKNPDQDSDTPTTQTPEKASSEWMAQAAKRWPDLIREPTAEEIEADAKSQVERAAERLQYEKDTAVFRFVGMVGRRYRECRLRNFEVKSADMAKVVTDFRAFATRMDENVRAGNGVVMFGPSGTGKDHLLIALGFIAAQRHGYRVTWKNGLELYSDIRDCFGDDARRTERQVIMEFARPKILILSDPLPPFGKLTEFQAGMLLRLLDERYRERRPTWVSMNVKNADEAAARMGAAIVDRLKHDALKCFCNWPSYRTSKGG